MWHTYPQPEAVVTSNCSSIHPSFPCTLANQSTTCILLQGTTDTWNVLINYMGKRVANMSNAVNILQFIEHQKTMSFVPFLNNTWYLATIN